MPRNDSLFYFLSEKLRLDRCRTFVDPDRYAWMVGTHKAEPTAKEMKKGMEEMMKHQPAAAAAAD